MTEIDLVGLFRGELPRSGSALDETASRLYGLTTGSVTMVGSGQRAGSVKLTIPALPGTETDWAPVVAAWAGRTGHRRRGAWFPPAVDDQALVAFRHGDPRHAYVLGFLWSETDPPPPGPAPDGLPRRGLYSGSGSRVLLDDTPGSVSVELATAGGRQVRLDDTNGTVVLRASSADGPAVAVTIGRSDVVVEASGGSVTVKGTDVTVQGSGGITLRSEGQIAIEAGGQLKLQGKPVRIN